MIVVPPPAYGLAPPVIPPPETPGLSALFDDIPRSNPEMPSHAPPPPAASFDLDAGLDIDFGAPPPSTPDGQLAVHVGAPIEHQFEHGRHEIGRGDDDPTVDTLHAIGLPQEPAPEQPLAASLVAAFEHNRTAPVEMGQVVDVRPASDSFLIGAEPSTMSMPSPIVVRMQELQQRLLSEGRDADAEVITQALDLLERGGG
jgi:hypothetical protein